MTSSSRRRTDGRRAGRLALVGVGVEPGLSDIFARYAQDHLFSEIDEIGVRDGANLVVDGYDFAPSFSIWTTIEECLNPPVIWEADRGWYTTPPFSEPEVFDFPEGIGPVECVNVEHEEVLLIPRWVKAKRVTFKYGLGDEFINVLKVLHMLGLDRTEKVRVGGVEVSPRDVVAAVLPDPAALGDRMRGKTCAGTWVKGTGLDGQPREVYLYHVVDNEVTMREDGSQAVVWQTAINPVVALELLATGVWAGTGCPWAGGVRRRAVPRAVDRVRIALGDARGRLIAASASVHAIGSAPERNVSDAGRHLCTDASIGHALLELRRHLSERSRARRDPGGGARHLLSRPSLRGRGYAGSIGGSQPAAASSNPANSKAGVTMQPTSVQAPSGRAACHAPAGTTAWTAEPPATSPPRR